jgi:nitrate reductase NapE component
MLKLYSIAEWTAFLCSILLFAKGVKKEYRIFFFYTLMVVVVESAGRWLAEELKIPNHRLFTFACFFFSCFYFFTTYRFVNNGRRKRIISLLFLTFLLFYLLNILFVQRLTEFNSYSFIAGYTLLTVACTFYYIEFINREGRITVFTEPDFFIISGYFIYSTLTAILYTIHRYFAYLNVPNSYYRNVFGTINETANVCLYLLLAIAFIIIWKKRKS